MPVLVRAVASGKLGMLHATDPLELLELDDELLLEEVELLLVEEELLVDEEEVLEEVELVDDELLDVLLEDEELPV